MKNKSYPIQIWFLDQDLQRSASFLSDKFLVKNINGCIQALLSVYFYFLGIRNKKFYDYYFNKERKQQTLDKLFPLWPFNKSPSYQQYTSKVSKWCRKCNEHFQYVKQYLEICCNEYQYRFGKQHSAIKLVNWIEYDAKKIPIKNSNVKNIVLEWKSINPKFRKKDIIQAYRLQYKSIMQNCGIKISDFSRRNIPNWILEEENKWLS